MTKKNDYRLFCYWCQMENTIVNPPLNHTFPVLIYPLLQSCFHKMHDSKQHEYTKFENKIKRENPEEFFKEMYMLATMFFQTKEIFDDFEVWVENSDQILYIDELKEYLIPFNTTAQEQIWYAWRVIEKDLYWAFLDREGPLEKDAISKYSFTKEIYDI